MVEFLKQEKLPRVAQDENFRLFQDSVLQFVNSQLRQESGAAIGDSEYESARKEYFPVPGDTEAIFAAKKKRRQRAAFTVMSYAVSA